MQSETRNRPGYEQHAPYHRGTDALRRRLAELGEPPSESGTVEMVVARPEHARRDVLATADLSRADGLVGDNWAIRGSRHTEDGSAEPARQITMMSSRVLDTVAGDRERWPLAGDQIIVDLDLSVDNLPPGTRLSLGSAALEVTESPHTGCAKFAGRFGVAALAFVSTREGKRRRYRGLNARVVRPGTVRVGDIVSVEERPERASSR